MVASSWPCFLSCLFFTSPDDQMCPTSFFSLLCSQRLTCMVCFSHLSFPLQSVFSNEDPWQDIWEREREEGLHSYSPGALPLWSLEAGWTSSEGHSSCQGGLLHMTLSFRVLVSVPSLVMSNVPHLLALEYYIISFGFSTSYLPFFGKWSL